MTDKQFYTLFGAALTEDDKDTFVSEWSLSSIWDDDPDQLPTLDDLAVICGSTWDLAHISVAEIRASTKLSQVAFATRFCIPRRTVENWEGGVNPCPNYVRLMLARLCGLADDIL